MGWHYFVNDLLHPVTECKHPPRINILTKVSGGKPNHIEL
jgi:hypothetical protein